MASTNNLITSGSPSDTILQKEDFNLYDFLVTPCKYIEADNTDSILCVPSGNDNNSNHSNMSFLHVNCRSLAKHFNNFLSLLDLITLPLSIIAVTETWLTAANERLYDIDGYYFVSQARPNIGGGVGLYIRKNLVYNIIDELCRNNPIIECIFVELPQKGKRKLIIGSLYRPPGSDLTMFISALRDILNVIDRGGGNDAVILGDFNIDLIKECSHALTCDFISTMYEHSFIPAISVPTRVTAVSSTLIDNIYINCANNSVRSGVILYDLSDHFPIIASLDLRPKNKIQSNEIIKPQRDFNINNIARFNAAISNPDLWTPALNITTTPGTGDTNAAMTAFQDVYSAHFRAHFPVKRDHGGGAACCEEALDDKRVAKMLCKKI